MKILLPIADCRLPINSGKAGARPSSIENRKSKTENAFTMVEIAISLAIIGIALVAILGVLPIGMRMQRDTREQTVINQDAAVLLEAIRGGARGADDLTNYVYAITNYWGVWSSSGKLIQSNVSGYTYTASMLNGAPMSPQFPINSGERIIGLLSTPEYTSESTGQLVPSLYIGGVSNHIVAYVRSLSGPAVEKPPQANDSIIREDSFSYRLLCVNAPLPMDTNIFSQYPVWQFGPSYPIGAVVLDEWAFWRADQPAQSGDVPGQSPKWVRAGDFNLKTAHILHELRLSFFWPQLPNGGLGLGRQTYRTMVAGQVAQTSTNGQWLYFYQPQSFTNAP